jgi:dynactin complex subunit
VEDPIDDANLVDDLIANYSVTLEEVPDINPDPVVLIRPAQALAAIQTLKEWEEQQDNSTHDVVRQLQALEKRVKCLQGRGLQQRTLASYFT